MNVKNILKKLKIKKMEFGFLKRHYSVSAMTNVRYVIDLTDLVLK